jgi:hypothetical protein
VRESDVKAPPDGMPIAGQVRDVSIHYPDFYPYFRFEAVVHGEPLFPKH